MQRLFAKGEVVHLRRGDVVEKCPIVELHKGQILSLRVQDEEEKGKMKIVQVHHDDIKLRENELVKVWRQVVESFVKAKVRGVHVREMLQSYIGDSSCNVAQFSKAVQALDGTDSQLIGENAMHDVLSKQKLLDALEENVLYSKLENHPELDSFLFSTPTSPGGASDIVTSVDPTILAKIESIYSKHKPVRIRNVKKVLLEIKGAPKFPSKYSDKLMKYFKDHNISPREDLTKRQVQDLCVLVNILPKHFSSEEKNEEKLEREIQKLIRIGHEQGVDCRSLFEMFDENFDGTISVEEFCHGLTKLGVETTQKEVQALLTHHNAFDSDGAIKYREFLALISPKHWRITSKTVDPHTAEVLEKLRVLIAKAQQGGISVQDAFQHFDDDGSGILDRQEFGGGLKELGFELSEHEVKLLMSYFESKNGAGIRYVDFCSTLLDHHAEVTTETKSSTKNPSTVNTMIACLKELLLTGRQNGVDWRDVFEAIDHTFCGLVHVQLLYDTICKYDFRPKAQKGKMGSLELFHNAMKQQGLTHTDRVSEVDYFKLVTVLCPGGWAKQPKTKSQRRIVDEILDMLCDAVSIGLAKGCSFNEIFQHFDSDNSGQIDPQEFQSGLNKILAVEIDTTKCRLLMREFEENNNEISYTSFVSRIRSRSASLNHLKTALEEAKAKRLDILQVFEGYDTSGRGWITTIDMCEALNRLGIKVFHDDLKQLVKTKYFAVDADLIRFHEVLREALGDDFVPLNRIYQVLDNIRDLLRRAEAKGVGLRDAFAHFDVDKSGAIDKNELDKGLTQLGISLDSKDLDLLMKHFEGEHGNSEISLEEFFKYFRNISTNNIKKPEDSKHSLKTLLGKLRTLLIDAQERGIDNRECFQHFDKSSGGAIGFQELIEGFKRLGFYLNNDDAQTLMNEFGVASLGGQISYSSFLRMVGVEPEGISTGRVIKRLQLSLARLNSTKHQALLTHARNGDFSLKSAFKEFDLNRDGTITRQEFSNVLTGLDLGIRDRDLHTILRRLDPNADGVIDYEELVKGLETERVTIHLRNAAKKLQHMVYSRSIDRRSAMEPFRHFDITHTGTITKREFRCGMSALGFHLGNIEMDVLCEVLDMNEDGKVHFDEFVRYMLPKKLGKQAQPGGTTPRVDGNGELLVNKNHDPLSVLELELQEFVGMAESMNIPLKETFRHFDKSGDGTITWEEFHSSMLELGFECTEMQLRKLMLRVLEAGSRQERMYTPRSPRTKLDTSELGDRIDYAMFLKYWSAAKDHHQIGPDTRTPAEVKKQVARLCKELKEFLNETTKRGVKVGDVFSHFDKDGDGKVTIAEFETATQDIFSNDPQYDQRVIEKFIDTVDTTRDGHIDYYEFLGLGNDKKTTTTKGKTTKKSAAHGTWQAVFGANKLNKRHAAESAAHSIMQLVIRRAEAEIDRGGPVWRSARKAISTRLNAATFIQRNKAAINNREYCKRSSRTQMKQPAVVEKKKETVVEKKKVETSLAKRIQIAERLHIAEVAAARMAEEAALRAEEAANRQKSKSIEESACTHAIEAIDGVVFFQVKDQAIEFLKSIGLGRFGGRICSRTYKNMENCYVFPVDNDHDMQQVMGTCSTIVARKVKRELLEMLSVQKEFLHADADPESWSVSQVAHFAEICGLDVQPFQHYEINGEALLEMRVEEALHELGFEDEVGVQRLLFRTSFLHWLARKSTKESDGGKKAYLSLTLDEKVIARPNTDPIECWSVDDVAQLATSLDIDDSEIRKLGIDGVTLLELTDEDIGKELNIQNTARFRTAIEAVRQPPWLSLGTGPYLEARVNAGMNDQDSGVVQSGNCTYFRTGREHDLWIHVGPALTKAFEVATKAVDTLSTSNLLSDKQIQREHQMLYDPYNDSTTTVAAASSQQSSTEENPGYKPVQIHQEEERLCLFIAQAVRAGLPVLEVFHRFDKRREEFLTWYQFEKALVELGFPIPDAGLFRLMLGSQIDKRNETRIHYEEFYLACLNKAQYHTPVFDRDQSDADIAFTTDGFMASLLMTKKIKEEEDEPEDDTIMSKLVSSEGGRAVRVRYGGGFSKYDATIVADHGNGTMTVQYSDNQETECVPIDWVENKPAAVQEKKKTENRGKKNCFAVCHSSFEKGVHVWSLRVKHLNHGVSVGVCSKQNNNMRFVGLSHVGDIVVRGYTMSRQKLMTRFSYSNRKGFSAGDVLTCKLDLDAQEFKVYRTTKDAASDLVDLENIADMEEIGKIRLDEVYKSNETEKVKQIKRFLNEHVAELEAFIMSKQIDSTKAVVPIAILTHELFEMGLDCSETDMLQFLQPFLNGHHHGVNMNMFMEGLNLVHDQQWDDEISSYCPTIALCGVGDCCQWLHTRSSLAACMKEASKIEIGSRVKVRYGGGSTWYNGTITETKDQLFSVAYDDGDTENCVKIENIQLLSEDKPKVVEKRDRVILKLYCRLFSYSLPGEEDMQKAAPATTKAKVLSSSGHRKIDLATSPATTLVKAPPKKKKKGEPNIGIERRGTSFSNVGRIRLQEILRKRLNQHTSVNWPYTINASHSFFTPLAMTQQHQKHLKTRQDKSQEKKHLTEEEWTLVGTIDVESMNDIASGQKGVPLSIRLGETQNKLYYRLCFMAILGTIDSEGNFTQIHAPVQPVQAVLENVKVRVGGGFDHDFSKMDSTDTSNHRASRFFLLSGPFRPTTSKVQKPDPPRTDSRVEVDETLRPQTPIVPIKPVGPVVKQTPEKSQKKLADNFSQDEKIVVDRWLALVGLNEFGEPPGTIYGPNRSTPLYDPATGQRLTTRYQYILGIHPSKPWMTMARDHGWLPSKEEQNKIRKWARKHNAEKPSRFSPQQTLYEALLQLQPSKPWSNNGARNNNNKPNNNKPRYKRGKPTTTKATTSSEIHKQIEESRKTLAENLQAMERDYEKIATLQTKANLREQVPASNQIQENARQIAKEATARANEEAQIQWERQEQIRRLKTIENKEARLDKRQKDLQKLEQDIQKNVEHQKWADRVAKNSNIPKPPPRNKDPWARSVKPNCPI